MIPEYGNLALVLALWLTVLLAVLPLWGSFSANQTLMRLGDSLSAGLFTLLSLGLVALGVAFLQDDFTVSYVANNSNAALPWYYKISAIWGGHEGSLLLWVWILAGWTLAVALFSKDMAADMRARVLSVLGMVGIGFMLFMLLTERATSLWSKP